MALQNAHSGYEYQDIYAALRLADILLSRASEVRVDVKLGTNDLFDDLTTIWNDGSWLREQLKHTLDPQAMQVKIFTSKARDCRLDDLVSSAKDDYENNQADRTNYEYRLISSDLEPIDPELTAILRLDSTIQPAQVGFNTKCYRLNTNVLWPEEAEADGPSSGTWKRVIAHARRKGLERADFEWFAEHFVLEVAAPKASFDLANPGIVEGLLLARVVDEIGAGIYPNVEHSAVEVASVLVSAARAAREGISTTDKATLLARTRLRSDFGGVSRAHPIDSTKEIEVENTVTILQEVTKQVIDNRVPLLINGPPGQGKTWVCDKLTRNLQENNWLVASHYCYLNFTEDASKDKRVRLEVVIASLLAQIAEYEPWCVDELRPRFAANSETLIAALHKIHANNPNKHIALIVDGLDHVTRVLGVTTGRNDPATDLAHELSLLDLPQNTVLIVACQKGVHDEPLLKAGAHMFELPSWEKADIYNLGVISGAIGTPGKILPGTPQPFLSSIDTELDELVDELKNKSKGNALYAMYCYSELRRVYDTLPQSVHDLTETLRTLPAFDGTMRAYYEYLIQAIPMESLSAANALAMLEFAVTRDELKSIFPASSSLIDTMINRLMPVLIERGMQGGLRVYHESFQRFIIETKLTDAAQRKATVVPIVDWLRAKGFYKDARAFRFLTSLLSEIGEDRQICQLIDASYVAKAIAACHGEAAIINNISVATEAAVHLKDWKAIVGYVELAKEIGDYAFSLMDYTLGDFSDIPIALNGANWFAERLLYEGRPVFPPRLGLQLCEAIDTAGGVPPWQEYIDIYEQTRNEDNVHYGQAQEKATTLAEVRGILRAQRNIDTNSLADWLNQRGLPHPARLTSMLIDVYGSAPIMLEVIRKLPKKRRATYLLALAEHLPRLQATQKTPTVNSLLTRAIKLGLSPWQMLEAVELGADAKIFNLSADELISQTKIILDYSPEWNEKAGRKWAAYVFIMARTDPAVLNRVMLLIQGPGWFRCWLEYVVKVAQHTSDSSSSILPAFKALVSSDSPFVGKPRACDLYRIHPLIAKTLRMGLSFVMDDEWSDILQYLQEVSDNTTTSLFNASHSGPLPAELLIKLATEFTSSSRSDVTSSFVENVIHKEADGRNYYSTLALYSLLRARLAIANGNLLEAEAHWEEAGRFNSSYGERKDVTIFELLEPMPELARYDVIQARNRLVRLQPLVKRVIRHTDLKETRHALPRWWELLGQVDGIGAGKLIARLMLDSPNHQAGQLQDAHYQLHLANGQKVSPIIWFASRLSLGYQSSSGNNDLALLNVIKSARYDELPSGLAADLISSLLEERLTDDHYDELDVDGFKKLASAIEELNGHALSVEISGKKQNDFIPRVDNYKAQIENRISTDWGEKPIEIARAIRRWSQHSYSLSHGIDPKTNSSDFVVDAIGWRLLKLCQQGDEETSENLLRFLISHLSYEKPAYLLRSLGQGFARHGYNRLAVIAYVAAYTKSRGGGGWRTFGGKEYEENLHDAVVLDNEQTMHELGMAIVDVLNGRFYGSPGVSQALIQAFCISDINGTVISPFELWDAAADIISNRLPSVGDADEEDDPYTPTTLQEDTIPALECAITTTVISSISHPEKPLKRGALLATAWLIKQAPMLTISGMQSALDSNLDPASKTWLLWLLLTFEREPYPVTVACKSILMSLSQSDLLTIRSMAARLLKRAGTTPPIAIATTPSAPQVTSKLPFAENPKKYYEIARKELARCAGERLMEAQTLAPELIKLTTEKLGNRINDKAFQQAYASQIESLTHPASKRQPDAYTLEQESVERVIQEVASGARLQRAKVMGFITDPLKYESELADILLDNPELPLRIAASRIPRPKLLPTLDKDGSATELPTILQGPYKSWRVLGFHESQISPGKSYENIPRNTVFIEGGAEVCTLTAAHDHPTPFGYGVALVWLEASVAGRQAGLTGKFGGPMSGIETGTVPKYFGLGVPSIVLAPHLALVSMLGLKAGNILDGLSLVDKSGRKAILARNWRHDLIKGADFGPPYPLIEGTDLIIRPDLLDELEKQFSPNLVRFCVAYKNYTENEPEAS